MSKWIQEIEQQRIAALGNSIPDFRPGDTLRVHVQVVEGERKRIQVFEGFCIARRNAGWNSSFTMRKLSFGEGVERVFALYSPRIERIEVSRRGRVRRAKLFYLRGRTGKKARITERLRPKKDAGNKKAKSPEAKDGKKSEKGGKPSARAAKAAGKKSPAPRDGRGKDPS